MAAPRPHPTRGRVVLVAAAAVAAAVVLVVLLGRRDGLLVLILGGQLGLFLYARRLSRLLADRVRRGDREVVGQLAAVRDAAAEHTQQLDVLQQDLAAMARALDALSREHTDATGRVEEELSTLRRGVRGQVTREHLRLGLRRHYDQVDALVALYHDLRPRQALPPMGTWAASPDLLRFLFGTIVEDPPELVVECGSGVSTVIMAYALEQVGAGRIVALEHLEEHADRTRSLLARHGLTHRASVEVAPLRDVEIDGVSYPWYDPDAVPAGPIDLLFVDGPPGKLHPHARLPALPLLDGRLGPGARIVLDDARREEEREVVRWWTERYPDLEVTEHRHEKGTMVLRTSPHGPGSDGQAPR